MSEILYTWNLGKQDFELVTTKLQKKILKSREHGDSRDVLILFEPNASLYSLGTDAQRMNTRSIFKTKPRISQIAVNRGGGVTYHGPGQIVGYYIGNLSRFDNDLTIYQKSLENGLLSLCNTFVKARIVKEPMLKIGQVKGVRQYAVWDSKGEKKIVATGIRVSKNGDTYHGFAMNVCPDISYFEDIIACGLVGKGAVSLEMLANGKSPKLDELMNVLTKTIAQALGYNNIKNYEAK